MHHVTRTTLTLCLGLLLSVCVDRGARAEGVEAAASAASAASAGSAQALSFDGATYPLLKVNGRQSGPGATADFETASTGAVFRNIHVSTSTGTTPAREVEMWGGILRPPVAIKPPEVVRGQDPRHPDDLVLISLVVNPPDTSKYDVSLMRFTALPDGRVRSITLEGLVSYSGLFKSLGEFERHRQGWLDALFALEPDLTVLVAPVAASGAR